MYTGKTATTFTGVTRATSSTSLADHAVHDHEVGDIVADFVKDSWQLQYQ